MPTIELDVQENVRTYTTLDVGVAQLSKDGVTFFTIPAAPTPVRPSELKLTFSLPSEPVELRRMLTFDTVHANVIDGGPVWPRR